VLAFVGLLARAAAAEQIKQIVVEDNTKTTTETVLLMTHVSVGDEWNLDLVEQIRQRLETSGLFREVEVFWDPVEGGVRLHLVVRDKFSRLVAPTFYDQPTNKGGGLGYGDNNLAGLNQKLLLYAQLATGDSFFLGVWQIPSIGGTHLYAQIDTYLRDSRIIEYAEPTKYIDNPIAVRQSRLIYLNGGLRLGYEIARGIKLDTRLRGAWVGYEHVELADGAGINDVTPGGDPTAPLAKPGKEGWDVSNEWDFTLDRRIDFNGVQSGYRYMLTYERALPALGSDFRYYSVGLYTLNAIKLLERHDLVLRGSLNIGHNLPFQQEFTTGGTAMRGWLNDQFRGDFKVAATAEYSFPLFGINMGEWLGTMSVRGLGFWDSAYTTFMSADNPDRNYLPNAMPRGLAPFKNSVGVGTRFYLSGLVLPLLGLDFGYGLEAGDFQIYLAIGLTT